jgi:hypothetical protein
LIIPDAQESYKARLAAASNNNGVLPREDALMMTFQREMVRNAILDVMTFKTQPDGIDPKLALCADSNADGKPDVSITVDELWERIADTVSETEIAETKQRFITSIAVRDRLAEDGALLSAAEAKNAVAKWKHRLEVEGRNPGQTATQDEFFPSLESFTEYYLLREGYRRMVAPKLASDRNGALSPTLRGHLDRAARAMGFGMVDSEVLLVSAMDIGHFRWKKNGWTHAHRKAQALGIRSGSHTTNVVAPHGCE